MNLSTKQKQTLRHREHIDSCQGVDVGWGKGRTGNLGLADVTSYIEWIKNKVLLYSRVNYIQYAVISHNGKEYKKECLYVDKSFPDSSDGKETAYNAGHTGSILCSGRSPGPGNGNPL